MFAVDQTDGCLYEWWLVVAPEDGRTLAWDNHCAGCDAPIGRVQVDLSTYPGVERLSLGFIPYWAHIAVEHRDNEESGEEDFTEYECVGCGVAALSDTRVWISTSPGGFMFLERGFAS